MNNSMNKVIMKINRIRKKNWSAPTIMGVFIITCMIIIFSCEALGLLNKEKNLDFRINSPEKMIKITSNDVKTSNIMNSYSNNNECKNCLFNDKISFEPYYYNHVIKLFTEKDKEKHIKEMKNILIEAAINQYKYEKTEKLESNFIDDFYLETLFYFDV